MIIALSALQKGTKPFKKCKMTLRGPGVYIWPIIKIDYSARLDFRLLCERSKREISKLSKDIDFILFSNRDFF